MSMSAGVAGARRRWDHDFTSGADRNIASAISGAPTTRPIWVEVPSAVTVGGVADEAISAGSLSSFVSVDCRIYGNAYGKGGAASSGAGGHAFDGNNQSNLTINVESGGELRGGGGGGGNGGLGGYGMDTTGDQGPYFAPLNDSPCSTPHDYMWVYGYGGTCYTYWAGVAIFQATSIFYTKKVGSYWYWPGGTPETAKYQIYRGLHVTGVKGIGGAGAVGQGYAQSAGSGVGGTSGTYRAGNGGTGGAGAAWAAAGSTGNTGGGGLQFTDATQNSPTSGGAGSAGGAAGAAVINFTGVTINNNGGTISGAYS